MRDLLKTHPQDANRHTSYYQSRSQFVFAILFLNHEFALKSELDLKSLKSSKIL